MLLPISQVWARAEIAKQESDTAYFFALLYVGELITKLVVSGLVACVTDDRSRSRYRQIHRLVRTDGIGEWSQVLDEILVGPTAQFLLEEVRVEQRQLTEKVSANNWQYEANRALDHALSNAANQPINLPAKVDGRRWFSQFAVLRNKTRGHGAPRGDACSKACSPLETSIRQMADNLTLCHREWAFLHQNLSGKYRVTALSSTVKQFESLRTTPPKRPLINGVYLYAAAPVRVELIWSDVDASDFLFPNGGFGDKTFEALSYTTDSKRAIDAGPYLIPASPLPGSETDGLAELDVIGQVHTNLPIRSSDYVKRAHLEEELKTLLTDDRYPIVTLLGRGGIGKTSLALEVLHAIAQSKRFETIIWFSARDIDLMAQGPKVVQPRVLSAKDIAGVFVSLIQPSEGTQKGFRAEEYLATALNKGPVGGAGLFVFDNFETVKNPTELYKWLSNYVRLPNKILITTRIRDFKADYPVEVGGMTDEESKELINSVAARLGIASLISDDYRRELINESDGHPYVLKILLGEVAKERRRVPIARVIAGKEEILDALFERTYNGLSLAAQRVYLTLCGWRSVVPQLALEAVILGRSHEPIDVSDAIEELYRWSLIEVSTSQADQERFLSTPLVASTFGRKKLTVSPLKTAVEADLQLLQQMGALQKTDVRHGVTTRIAKLVRSLLRQVATTPDRLEEFEPILQFIANRHPPTWLELSGLYEELNRVDKASYATRRFLECDELTEVDRATGWERLGILSRRIGDQLSELQSLVERARLQTFNLDDVSAMANRMNSILRTFQVPDREERRILVRQMVKAFEARINMENADATDLSRLAWLHLHLGEEGRAHELAERGFSKNPHDEYCVGILRRLAT